MQLNAIHPLPSVKKKLICYSSPYVWGHIYKRTSEGPYVTKFSVGGGRFTTKKKYLNGKKATFASYSNTLTIKAVSRKYSPKPKSYKPYFRCREEQETSAKKVQCSRYGVPGDRILLREGWGKLRSRKLRIFANNTTTTSLSLLQPLFSHKEGEECAIGCFRSKFTKLVMRSQVYCLDI